VNNAVKAIVFVSVLTIALPAQACFAPPPELIKHHRDLVADSATIVLARALAPVSAETGPSLGDATPRFEAVEVLKGAIAPKFSLANGRYLVASNELEFLVRGFMSDFNGHRDIAVWDKRRTRQWNEPDCQMMPRFEPGETYLLFPDHPHWRAYELIRREDDLWLTAVRNLVADPSRRSGLSVTVPQWLSLAPGAFVFRINSCDTPDFEVVEVLLGDGETVGPDYRSQRPPIYYGSRRDCKPGMSFLTLVYYQSEADPDYVVSANFDVDDGKVDFGKAIDGDVSHGTELHVTGSRIWSLDDLKTELAKLQQP
jgi:hypothetical protein